MNDKERDALITSAGNINYWYERCMKAEAKLAALPPKADVRPRDIAWLEQEYDKKEDEVKRLREVLKKIRERLPVFSDD